MSTFPKAVGFDLETWGVKQEYALQPFRMLTGEAGIRAASFATDTSTYGGINPNLRLLGTHLSTFASKDIYVVGWNVSFDAAWCISADLEKEVFAVKWLDAMLLWRHVVIEPEDEGTPSDKRKSYSLEAALKEFFPEGASIKDFKDFQATDQASLERLLDRNKGDALYALKLARFFWDQLSPERQRAALIEARCIPMVAKTKVLGIKSSVDAANALSIKLEQTAVELDQKLRIEAPEAAGINFGSPKQVATLLYETWKLPASRFSKETQAPSTDKFALFDLAFIDSRAKLLKELRESKNNRTKYAEATRISLEYNGDGFIRPSARIFGTYTSRMTYSSADKATITFEKKTKKDGLVLAQKRVEVPTGVALHQWKRGKDYRRLIQAPPGYLLCEFDAAGQEFRWMGEASEDETMLSLCAPGEDPHSYMGAAIAQSDYRELIAAVHREEPEAAMARKMGKFANLSFQYRVSAATATTKARVDYELDVDELYIKNVLATYKSKYPGVARYWQKQINNCKSLGYAETFAGRRVQLRKNWVGKEGWQMESTSINYPIQGTGGDEKYLAMALARNHLAQHNGYFYYELHDGLFFIFPEATAEKSAWFFKQLFSSLPYRQAWGFNNKVAHPFDAKIGPSWGDLKELK